MATTKQVAANRRNAKRSTGPKTAAGKAVSKLNAVRHGLLAQTVLLPDEDPEEFNELYDNLMAELAPVGEIESRLADRISACLWRLRRVGAIETGIFVVRERLFEEQLRQSSSIRRFPVPLMLEAAKYFSIDVTDLIADDLDQYEMATDPTKRRLRVLGGSYVTDVARGDTLSKLSRYEAAIELSMLAYPVYTHTH